MVAFCVLADDIGDVEGGGGVTVFCVTDEGAVNPHVNCGCEAFEGEHDAARFAQHLLEVALQGEVLAVEGYVVLLGDVRSFGVFVAVPGHLDVDVGGAPESFSFQGGGDGDALVVAFVEGGGGEFCGGDVNF